MATYRLTTRHGSKVTHERFEDLDEAIDAMRERVKDIRREGPLPTASAIRRYGPGAQVHARLALATGGRLRGREAGLDVMGDGGLVPYVGLIRKRRLEPGRDQTPFDALRAALA